MYAFSSALSNTFKIKSSALFFPVFFLFQAKDVKQRSGRWSQNKGRTELGKLKEKLQDFQQLGAGYVLPIALPTVIQLPPPSISVSLNSVFKRLGGRIELTQPGSGISILETNSHAQGTKYFMCA